MTSEIVIMNNLAVAIAADSAVTLFPGEKIFKTANKLFALSKFQPVGIMFFNSAEINGVPWETIVKMYRKSLGKESRDTIQDYFKDFINFLENNTTVFPLEQQKIRYRIMLGAYLYAQRIEIDENIEKMMQKNKSITDDEINKLFNKYFDEEFEKWEGFKNASGIDNSFINEIMKNYEDIFKELLDDIYQNYSIKPKLYEKLKILSAYVLCKEEDFETSFNSGVVITGFGRKRFIRQ